MLIISIIAVIIPCLNAIQVANLTGRSITIIEAGKMKIVEGNLKIIHKINVNQLQTAIELITQNLHLVNNSEIETLLELERIRIKNNLQRILPRSKTKRAFSSLGSALKWAAGTPDEDDLKYIEGKISELKSNNNQQIKINEDLSQKINELVERINKLSINPNFDTDLITTLLSLKTVSYEVEAVQEAIVLAKQNIVSSKLVTNEEVDAITDR